ncbi:MAG: TlpA family protein disulfide reductase [Flavobacteriales bacterium]|jgi:cytochrome c biogenesis protein CcmG, thiol:disulfide interchange protein DsbE|nr:TlpA family protein disulfide reductase [Flavobacteriales bacterium]
MNKKTLLSILASLLFTTISIAQKSTLPSLNVKTLDGSNINITTIENSDNPIVISFWATWCKPCKKELNTIAEVYEDWQDETGVKLVAISIDDTRSMAKVAPYVNASDWDYEVYLDPNGDLKRAMGVSTVPHTFLLNSKKEIVWQHKGYVDGDEDELLEQIEKLSK